MHPPSLGFATWTLSVHGTWAGCPLKKQTPIWVWVKFEPPENPQILVHVSIYQDSILGTYCHWILCVWRSATKKGNRRLALGACPASQKIIRVGESKKTPQPQPLLGCPIFDPHPYHLVNFEPSPWKCKPLSKRRLVFCRDPIRPAKTCNGRSRCPETPSACSTASTVWCWRRVCRRISRCP